MTHSPSTYVAVVGFAFLAGLFCTWLMRRLATRWNWVDCPDAMRKIQPRAVALGGGVAVLLGAAATLVLPMAETSAYRAILDRSDLFGLFVATLIVFALGVWDDVRGMRARHKLLGQMIACLVLVSSGLSIQSIQLFGADFELGLMAWPFTMFWLLGCINALNLIDGADGLAGTVGCILCGAIAAMTMITGGHSLDVLVALALMGSLMGFLAFNLPPASIYLGDAGSMVIGLIAGALAMRGAIKGAATFAIAAPLAIWAIPALDCAAAIVRRKMTGRGISSSDRGHLHHCVMRSGYNNRQMLLIVGGLCLVTAVGAVASVKLANEWYAIGAIALVVASLVYARIFGHAELVLVASSFRDLGASLLTPSWVVGSARATQIRLQGSGDWDRLWTALVETLEPLDIVSVRLHLNLPWVHEAYHASWQAADPVPNAWKLEFPLIVRERNVGQIRVKGRANDLELAVRLNQALAAVAQFTDAVSVEMQKIDHEKSDAGWTPRVAPDGESRDAPEASSVLPLGQHAPPPSQPAQPLHLESSGTTAPR